MNRPLMLAALLLPLASLAVADEPTTTLDPVVVTATRTPEPENRTLASVTVIDRAEIERSQARSVPDVLRGVPGVAIAQSGGAGQPASVFLRGTNADHVLVLIDGVKIGSATSGTSPLEDLPIEQIERIEVVRGPRSSLYGSEAIGGVIQIFTKQGGGPLSPRLSVGGGSLGTAEVSAGVSGGGERAWFNLGASLDRTDGINACDGRSSPFAGCGVEQLDRDRYRNLSVNLRGGYAFSDTAKLDVHLLSSENRSHFDGSLFAGNLSRSEQQVLGTTATLRPLEPWTLILSAGHSSDKYRTFFDNGETGTDDLFVDSFETERDTFSLQNNVAIGQAHLLTLGADYQDDHVSGSVDYAEDARDDLGVFGEYQGRFGPSDLKLSLRQDDNAQFGGHSTGNAAGGYRFETGCRFRWPTARPSRPRPSMISTTRPTATRTWIQSSPAVWSWESTATCRSAHGQPGAGISASMRRISTTSSLTTPASAPPPMSGARASEGMEASSSADLSGVEPQDQPDPVGPGKSLQQRERGQSPAASTGAVLSARPRSPARPLVPRRFLVHCRQTLR